MQWITTRRLFFAGILLVGAGVGWWHARNALTAVMVFRQGEPATSWITVLFGPFSTLPALVASLFSRKVGGYWLIVGSLISLMAFVIESTENVLPFFLTVTLPMLALGGGLLLTTPDRSLVLPQSSSNSQDGR